MTHRFTKLAIVGLMAASPVVLGACVIVDADEHTAASWDLDRDYGSLKGAEVSANQITARVSSNGCTTKDFIGTDVRKSGDDSFTVGFFREKQDYCRANLPDGVELSWSFEELGIPNGADVSVRNRVGG
ncbi:hypothetical protein [Henriciella litoralis]|uniref:hypothetical protein n=1 Tax=Henriciella litoralis TaxID=568102 RepID=UPI0009FCEFB5|nr:hypothetical protein [Henriciella litoralis]